MYEHRTRAFAFSPSPILTLPGYERSGAAQEPALRGKTLALGLPLGASGARVLSEPPSLISTVGLTRGVAKGAVPAVAPPVMRVGVWVLKRAVGRLISFRVRCGRGLCRMGSLRPATRGAEVAFMSCGRALFLRAGVRRRASP